MSEKFLSFALKKKSTLWITLISFDCLVVDQILKYIASIYFKVPLEILPFLNFRYEKNFGIAWSIPMPYTVLITLNIILLLAVPLFLFNKLDLTKKINYVLLGALIGGALGNIADRIFRGYVVDFISIGNFPVFNLADCFITLSIFIILIFYDRIARRF